MEKKLRITFDDPQVPSTIIDEFLWGTKECERPWKVESLKNSSSFMIAFEVENQKKVEEELCWLSRRLVEPKIEEL